MAYEYCMSSALRFLVQDETEIVRVLKLDGEV